MTGLLRRGRWLLLEFVVYVAGSLAFLSLILREWWIMGVCLAVCALAAAVNLRAARKTRAGDRSGGGA